MCVEHLTLHTAHWTQLCCCISLILTHPLPDAQETVVKPKHKSRLQEAEEEAAAGGSLPPPGGSGSHPHPHRKGHEAEEELVSMLLRPLPEPPAFPASAAWDYVIAAQDGIAGMTQLQAVLRDMRAKVKVGGGGGRQQRALNPGLLVPGSPSAYRLPSCLHGSG